LLLLPIETASSQGKESLDMYNSQALLARALKGLARIGLARPFPMVLFGNVETSLTARKVPDKESINS